MQGPSLGRFGSLGAPGSGFQGTLVHDDRRTPVMKRWVRLAFAMLCSSVLFVAGCRESKKLEPPSLTFAELRSVRPGIVLEAPNESPRAPYRRHRLVDGTKGQIEDGGLCWLRRDDGAVFLLRGPSGFVFGADSMSLSRGRAFIAAPPGVVVRLETPQGSLRLANARVSAEIGDNESSLYVLRGELVTAEGVRAGVGERLVMKANGAITEPQLVWNDWTGGLATTDRSPAPPPFGVGTIGARPPGSEGTAREPLVVQRLALNVKFDGDFVITEVDQTFFNAASKTVEGIYRFRTPSGANLIRFGVDRGRRLVWGRIKEKHAAQAQYESNVYEGSTEDPALLEWSGPGEYQARLYPIEAGASRRVVVRYTEWLPRMGEDGERRLYTYPMAAEGAEETLPRIEEMTATFDLLRAGAREVRSGMQGTRTAQTLVVRAHDFVPRADLSVELFDSGNNKLRAYRARHQPDLDVLPPETQGVAREAAKKEPEYVFVPLRAEHVTRPNDGIDLAIIVDTSAATEASSLNLAAAVTHALLEHMGERDRAIVWTGADGLRPLIPGQTELAPVTASTREAVRAGLASVQPGGATDLGTMLSEARSVLSPDRASAVVYVGDAAPTVGEMSLQAIEEKLSRLPRRFRVFALGTGEGSNLQILDGIAKGGFADRLIDNHSAAQTALRVLESAERPTTLGVGVDFGPSVERVYPRGSMVLNADEGVLVIGRLVGAPPKSILVKDEAGQKQLDIAITRVDDHGDLRLRWAGARLLELLEQDAGRAAFVDLGTRYGLVTPVTSLYVPTASELQMEDAIQSLAQGPKPEQTVEEESENQEGGTGTRAKGDEGTMGRAGGEETNKRYAVAGPKDDSRPAARAMALRDAVEFGVIGDAKEAAPDEASAAPEPKKAMKPASPGNMWGDEVGDASGSGGLGLSGTGDGGGGTIGTIGHGAGTGTGQGFGSGHGRLGGSHKTVAPKLRFSDATVDGDLPKEVIARIVRQNFGRFRLCYERGLARNPNLSGSVVVRFTIGSDGNLTAVSNGGSTLPDAEVVGCIQTAYYGLSFPSPERGSVNVRYSLALEPGAQGNEAAGNSPVEPEQAAFPRSKNKLTVAALDFHALGCGLSSALPLAERAILWRERLAGAGASPSNVASVYRRALRDCESPDWRSRSRLFALMLDALPSVTAKVSLWRILFDDLGARDPLYRGILARVKSAADLRELHDALGLESIDSDSLSQLLAKAPDAAARIDTLKRLSAEWPNDFALSLLLLSSLEDAKSFDEARGLAHDLRARPDVSDDVRTAIGEFYLRLSRSSPEGSEAASLDLSEAKRTFGELVEFAPEDPAARRRLGDLLLSHGFHDEARRQYETLAVLVPDDPTTGFLVARAARGQGRLEESMKWLDQVAETGDPDSSTGPARTSRALALAYLSWGRDAARREGAVKDAELLLARAQRVAARAGVNDLGTKGTVRVTLTWTHPDFHPTLWTNALTTMMPSLDGDVRFGVSEAFFPLRQDTSIEIRLEELSLERMVRYGAGATLTVVFDEFLPSERIVIVPVRFETTDSATLRFALSEGKVTRG